MLLRRNYYPNRLRYDKNNWKAEEISKRFSAQTKPVVMVGNKGVSEAVLKEIDATLEAHELIRFA